MDIGKLTDYYVNEAMRQPGNEVDLQNMLKNEEAFGAEFKEVYDSLQAIKMLNSTVRDSFNGKMDKIRNGDSSSPKWVSRGSQITDIIRENMSETMNCRVNGLIHEGFEKMASMTDKGGAAG